MISSLERTAYHEAGHAACSLRLGLLFDVVSVKPEGNTLGHIMMDDVFDIRQKRANATKRSMIAYAGFASEILFCEDADESLDGASSDFGQIVDELMNAFENSADVDRRIDQIAVNTYRLLRRSSTLALVTALANALIEKETLTFDEAIEIAITTAETGGVA